MANDVNPETLVHAKFQAEALAGTNQELAMQENHQSVVVITPMEMLSIAVQKGTSMEQLTQLMALQERWEANEAKKAFNVAFSAFKAEAIRVIKNKAVSDGPLKGKSYAELHAVVDAVTPAMSAHGLGHSWKITKDEKDWIEVTCMIRHSLGHSESMSMGGPPDAGGAKNAIQARVSTVSYLERCTLKAICGVAEKGDDTDGNTPSEAGQDSSDTDTVFGPKKLLNHNTVLRNKFATVVALKAAVAANDYYEMAANMDKLTDEEKTALWVAPTAGGIFTTAERAAFKSNEYLNSNARADYYAEKETKQETVK